MKRLLSFSFLLLSSFVSAQNRVEPLVAVKVADSKFQFVNRQTGIPASPQLWDETEPFMNGYARVFLNNKFSFVNDKATLISPVVFEGARNFSNNLAAVKKDGKWGFINGSGKIVFPFRYNVVFDFEGTVSVGFENKKWWLINNNGETIKQLDISVCYGFKNAVAKINKDGKNGKINANGEIIFDQPSAQNKKTIIYNPAPNATAAACPDNIDFENGDFTNWECFTGIVDSVGTTNVITVVPSPPTPNRHDLVPRMMPSALDPYGLFPTNPPDGSNFAVKLGNTNVGAEAERIRYTIRVPVNDTNFTIKYDYAVVLEDPGHTIWTQPRFNAKLLDSATNTYIQCASFEYISTSNLPGFQVSPVDPAVIFKDWSSVFFSLRGYGGKTVYLEFTTADCVRKAHWGYAYLDVETPCDQDIQMEYDCDFPNITTLTAPPGFQTYNWWNQNYTTLLGTGQQVVLNPGPAVNTIIWLEMIPFANFGCTDTLMAKITGNLNAQFDMSSASGCAPHTFTFYNRNLPSTTTVWDFGDGTFGTGDTVTHTYSTPGTYTVTLNVTVLSGCNGTATHQVLVKPIPDVAQPPNLNVCNTASTNTVIFSGSVAGTTFSWTNNNPAIGLPASGNGNIPSFTATNATNAVVSATITVTPTAAGCPGPPETFTINVRPTPGVVQPPGQILCNGVATNAIIFSGPVTGTTFTWTNNNTSIGLAAGGNGNISSFSAVNTTNAPVTATIIITPSAGGCPGAPQAFTITVNPTPDIAQPPHQNLCNGAATNTIGFSGSVANTTYTWTNNNTLIGLG
ncbi:MAG TPA: WG repeat-containing protein, partial [Ferruginibacter sp.]|nr:WG repeat-containing protein [Ferruginibacter sp.]